MKGCEFNLDPYELLKHIDELNEQIETLERKIEKMKINPENCEIIMENLREFKRTLSDSEFIFLVLRLAGHSYSSMVSVLKTIPQSNSSAHRCVVSSVKKVKKMLRSKKNR